MAVTEGGRRFMAAWRKEEEGVAKHRQEKREAMRLGKFCYRTRKQRRILRSDTHWPSRRESKESLYGRETNQDLRNADTDIM